MGLSRGKIEVKFAKMRIRHPRVASLIEACESIRETAADRSTPKRPSEMFAESHTGKSTAITTYIEDVIVPEVIRDGLFPADMPVSEIAGTQSRVIHVTLTEKATRKSLYVDILERLGDPEPTKGTVIQLRQRVYKYLKDKRVELLILDEIQHLSVGITREIEGREIKEFQNKGTDVTDCLKNLMIKGFVPMLLVGIPEARIHLSVDRQFTNRILESIDFAPILWSEYAEREVFIEYCGSLGILIHQHGLLPEISNLLLDGVPHRLWAATGGCMGLVSRIGAEAVFHASARNADALEIEDWAMAVDTLAIPQNYCLYNPFIDDVHERKIIR